MSGIFWHVYIYAWPNDINFNFHVEDNHMKVMRFEEEKGKVYLNFL